MSEINIYKALSNVQKELKAPKNQYNSFGKYSYRSAEDILEAVKPLLDKHNLLLVTSDEVVNIGNSNYVCAITRLYSSESDEFIQAKAYAREAESKKGMDDSQITGTASSYARKYAYNGIFAIDDTKDADSDAHTAYRRANDAKRVNTQPETKKPTEEQLDTIKTLAKNKGLDDEAVEASILKIKSYEVAEASIKKLKG